VEPKRRRSGRKGRVVGKEGTRREGKKNGRGKGENDKDIV
jgi:hypothetical protein